MFKEVGDLNFPEIEKRIFKFWDQVDAFSKLRKKNQGGPVYSFVDGPITANNLRGIGVHHAWGRTYKDIFQRYKAMQGFDQRYQNGFDCQGLWVEVEVEKDLDLNSKKDILEYGLGDFSRKCRQSVDRSADAIIETSRRLGQWMDWECSYYTYSDENIEHIWHFLKVCHQKGWLYKGHRVMPWCARCGTSLSQHELADAYDEMTHRAVYMKLPIRERKGEHILVWTTTPWTLTSNVALAVHPDLEYIKARQGHDVFYLSKGTVERLLGDYKVLNLIKGNELVGLTYEGPFDDLPAQQGVEHRIIPWDQVGEEEGTGVVHIAPGCGAEDYELARIHGLQAIAPLDEDGVYQEGFGNFSFKSVFEAAPMVFESLKEKGLLYKLEDYTHRYPRCWRCKDELVFRLVDEWFISCDEIRPQMLKAAQSVCWIPDHSGKRMEDWLNNMGDWCISRKRYWGLPLPFYESEDGELIVVGSVRELREKALDPKTVDELPELHRPWIDEVEIRTPSGSPARRIFEVGDCWLDAGIVPFSTLGYTSGDRSSWEKWFPAEFVTEMREQIRLWFYSMLFMGVTLEGRSPYRKVLTYEKMNDELGRPMHKSTGNTIWFDEAVEMMGAEPMRWLFADQNLSLNLNFGYGPASEVKRRFLTLWNTTKFFIGYAIVDGIDPNRLDKTVERTLTDRWILSRLQVLVRTARKSLDQYDLPPLIKSVEAFFGDLSNWYVRLNRRRFWKSDSDRDKAAAYLTLHETLVTLCKLLGPILPFLSEEIYQNLVRSIDQTAAESVHLCDYPEVREELIDERLMAEMRTLIRLVSLGRSARTSSGLKVRQPLSEMVVVMENGDSVGLDRLRPLILQELNVKDLRLAEDRSSLVDHTIKINFGSVGKKHRELVPGLKVALEAMDSDMVASRIKRGDEVRIAVEGQTIGLVPDDLVVETKAAEGMAVAEEGGVVVALDTRLTKDLEDEGFARECVHKIQNMRKEQGLEILDRVRIDCVLSPRLKDAVERFGDYIKAETLCEQLVVKDRIDEEADILVNGEKATLKVRRVEKNN